MASILIQIERDGEWSARVECERDMSADQLADMLAPYAVQYPHRAYLDGVLVATAKPGRRGAKVTRA